MPRLYLLPPKHNAEEIGFGLWLVALALGYVPALHWCQLASLAMNGFKSAPASLSVASVPRASRTLALPYQLQPLQIFPPLRSQDVRHR